MADNRHQRSTRPPKHRYQTQFHRRLFDWAALLLIVISVALLLFVAVPRWMERPLEEELYPDLSQSTLHSIRELSSTIKADHLRWQAGVTGISHLSPEEFSKMLGGNVPTELENQFDMAFPGAGTDPGLQFLRADDEPSDLPSRWDWRDQDMVTAARHQGSCGSCWAFAAAAALESRLLIYDNFEMDVSEQQAINCNYDNYGCDGGWMTSAYRIWKMKGAFHEYEFPYKRDDADPCYLNDYEPEASVTSWELVSPDREALKRAILVGPVAAGIHIYSNFQHYRGGVYEHEGVDAINHAVLMVGWDDDLGAWIIKNSWGAAWGDRGFAYIAYDNCQLGRYTHRISIPAATSAKVHHAAIRDTLAEGLEIELEVIYASMAEPIDVRYMNVHVDEGNGYVTHGMSRSGGDDYEESFRFTLPAYASGTAIRYYFEAVSQDNSRFLSPAAGDADPHLFRIMNQLYMTDFADGAGWSSAGSDNATGGTWEWAQPQPTYGVLGDLAQPDSDHGSDGYCFLTGATAGESANSNDVDEGVTTLLSPVFDLSGSDDAQVRFWYWFSNHWGHYPWEDAMEVDLTNDGGISWVQVFRTQIGDQKWREVIFELSDYLPLTSSIQLRFAVADSLGDSLVEAAIDDFQILSSNSSPAAIENPDPDEIDGEIDPGVYLPTQLHLTLGPNPTSGGTRLTLALPAADYVKADLFDASGRRVRSLWDGEMPAGVNRLSWDGLDATGQRVPSGRYFARVATRGRQLNRPLIVLR
jgi:C1A family cysteine protease